METTASSKPFFLAMPSNKSVQTYLQKSNAGLLEQAEIARM
jgi:hypothetical protein